MRKKIFMAKKNKANLVYQATRLDPRVIEAATEDVKKKKYKNKNTAYNNVLKSHYKIE